MILARVSGVLGAMVESEEYLQPDSPVNWL